MSEWEPPRCIHGRILLGCPDDTCPTQNAYLDQQRAAMAEYEDRLEQNARDLVRSLLEGGTDE